MNEKTEKVFAKIVDYLDNKVKLEAEESLVLTSILQSYYTNLLTNPVEEGAEDENLEEDIDAANEEFEEEEPVKVPIKKNMIKRHKINIKGKEPKRKDDFDDAF